MILAEQKGDAGFFARQVDVDKKGMNVHLHFTSFQRREILRDAIATEIRRQ